VGKYIPQTRPATLLDASELSRLSAQFGYSVAEADMAARLRVALASPLHMVIVAEGTSALAGWAAAEGGIEGLRDAPRPLQRCQRRSASLL
jgi:hypothetical protein